MKASFQLTLDTTAPQVEIVAPNYTTTEALTEIIVQADEPIANWQEVYVTESDGTRHDLIFTVEENRLTGYVRFNQFGEAIVNIHARLRDDVDNTSDPVTHTLHIRETLELTMILETQSRSIRDSQQRRRVTLGDRRQSLGLLDRRRQLEIWDTNQSEGAET